MRGIVSALEAKAAPKPIVWIASSRDDLRSFPEDIKDRVGHALWFAQTRRTHDSVKALKGFGGAHVLEVVESFEGNAYRAVYTVKFESYVYVLHCFQKKSKRGMRTPMLDVKLIESRLKVAEADHRKRTGGK